MVEIAVLGEKHASLAKPHFLSKIYPAFDTV